MKRKALSIILLVCVVSLAVTLPAAAYYTAITGEIRDSATDSPWVHGATVNVYQCTQAGTLGTLQASQTVDATGTFTVSLTGVNASWLCIRIDFNDGGSGQPATWFSPASIRNHPTQDTGTHDLGIIYTNTGPAAVTLNQVSAAASAGSPALIAFGMMLLGAVSLVAVRRSRI